MKKKEWRMIRCRWNLKWMAGLIGILWVTACEPSEGINAEGNVADKYSQLEFLVFSQAVNRGNTNASWQADEFRIKELYIYAFDDLHTRPDFFQDVLVNNGQGAIQHYKVKMSINGLGKKRFYLIANPPLYIKQKLTVDCTEGQLKTMSIALQYPIERMQQFPQNADGASQPADRGFPMANQLTAEVKLGKLKGELILTATEHATDKQITQIPIFRSLGKVSVTIRKKDTTQDGVFVKSLRIFNYTCNGYFLPHWKGQVSAWIPDLGIWNKDVEMDLERMCEFETKVGVDAVSLLHEDVWVDTVQPQTLASFYLCQNSYGEAMLNDTQQGVPDTMGNRTTKLAIELSDGRESVVDFPYLRRNDHLKVSIVIAKNIIQVTFLPWGFSESTPDWEDELLPSPTSPV